MLRIRSLILAVAGLGASAGSIDAQPSPTYPASFNTPMELYRVGLGPFSRRITTASPEAQAYFDQGAQLMFAFTPEDAARSFREAQKRDSTCAMCFWAEAWAWGPYLNGQMSADDAPRAYAAIQRARALASRTTDVERALIEAMAVRYEPAHDDARRRQLDSAYANAMARVYERFPTDPDVGTLYAESLMLLLPRRGTWDMHSPIVHRIHTVLADVLARNLDHPGACHLFVHATETTPVAGNAERCAEVLGQSIPGASHINHMPSHTYNRIGRWGDAVRANIEAWHSDLRAEWGEGFAIYPSHNLHMLLFSASYDGQGAIAIQAAKDYAKISRGGQFYHALTLLRFGRFDEVLELETAPPQPLFRAMWEFARGYAHLRRNAPDSARASLAWVTDAARTLPESDNFRGHPPRQLLGILGGILEGELLISRGDTAQGIAALERASALEDSLRYDEPEPLPFSPKHWLGAALLEAGRAADAERVYRAELAQHPRNGWSLYGLAASLRAQGRREDAERVQADFRQAWARSEVLIRASRF
ncbi:MAG TPA: hypothetical protein VF178_07590 [Gemmatimonadaceae bacterium]